MKLIKCYIENFGKLHKFEYIFKDGLNIINEENGFGKTTFASFIKSMFYGLDGSTNAKVENSERKLYQPWQGGVYGGNIEFEIEKMHITLEKLRQTKRDLENENENLDFKINNLKKIIKRIQDENDGI